MTLPPTATVHTRTNPCLACSVLRSTFRCDCGAPPEHAPDCSYVLAHDDLAAIHQDAIID